MPFSGVLGQKVPIQMLTAAVNNNRVPSAFLFIGPPGVGKSLIAKCLATGVNCEIGNACGECDNCRLFASGNHPDFIVLKPSGNFIKIAQIQELTRKLDLKPSFARKRVALVRQAQKLNKESGNAFLKTLEEPPLDTLLILTAEDNEQLLETIISRCQPISFSPLSKDSVNSILSTRYQLEENHRTFVVNHSAGGIRKDLAEKGEELIKIRGNALKLLEKPQAAFMIEHCEFIERAAAKNNHLYVLEMLKTLLRDLVLLTSGGDPKRSINADIQPALRDLTGRYSAEQLAWMFDLTLETEKAARSFAGKAQALIGLAVQLKQVAEGKIVV